MLYVAFFCLLGVFFVSAVGTAYFLATKKPMMGDISIFLTITSACALIYVLERVGEMKATHRIPVDAELIHSLRQGHTP